MSEVTYYVVQPFVTLPQSDMIAPGQPLQMPTETAARLAVARLMGGAVGAFAFSRTGDPDAGEWADAVILATNGKVPVEYTSCGLPW